MAWQLDISAMTSQETNKIEISMCNPTQLFERCKILKAEKDRAYAEKIRQERRLIDETIKTNKAQSGEQNQMTEIWLTVDSCFWTSQASLDSFCMASSAAAKPRARPRKVIAIQDLDALKAKKQQLKQDLKEMNKTVKVQQQKKRRLMKAAHNLHDEDLLWLLRERQTQRSEDPNSTQDQNGDAAEDLSAENVEPNETVNSEEHVNRTSDGAQSNE